MAILVKFSGAKMKRFLQRHGNAGQGVGWSRVRGPVPRSGIPRVFELNPDIHVTVQTPPTFLLHAENDPVDNVENCLVYFAALKKAGVPVEMHLYAQGGACVWPAAHNVSNYGVASVGRNLVKDDRDDLRVGTRTQPMKQHRVSAALIHGAA